MNPRASQVAYPNREWYVTLVVLYHCDSNHKNKNLINARSCAIMFHVDGIHTLLIG